MDRRRIRHISALTMLCMSVALLGWAVLSNWTQREIARNEPSATMGGRPSAVRDSVPPQLDSRSVKASLKFPKMISRGPQPGGDLVAKPLPQP